MSTEPATRDDRQITAPYGSGEPSGLGNGSVLAGRYVVDHVIGEGGMGEVYLAKHQKIDKLVAIKVLAPEQARRPKTVSRFLQEAKAASKIRHENIVDITDFGEDDGCVFLVMEYLEGEDLRFLLEREGRLPWRRARAIIIQVLDGLGAAHEAGVVHRDVKPHNCFISARETNPEFVKVIDFGIAKVRDGSEEQLTRTGAIMGTAEYMSPEQGQGCDLDGRSDLYSAGVILYRMLTGRVPFKAGNAMAILYQHVHTLHVPPSEACPEADLGDEVDALVAKALAKDPNERFASTAAFAAALREIDDPSATRSGTVVSRPRRSLRVGATVAATLALGLGLWAATGNGGSNDLQRVAASTPVGTPVPEQAATTRDVAAAAPIRGASAAPTKVAAPLVNADSKAPLGAATDAAAPTPAAVPGENTARPSQSGDGAAQLAPTRRSKRHVRSVLDRLRSKVQACGKKGGLFPGEKVGVTLTIAPSGKPTKVTVSGLHTNAGSTCVTKAIKRARFDAAPRAQSVQRSFTI